MSDANDSKVSGSSFLVNIFYRLPQNVPVVIFVSYVETNFLTLTIADSIKLSTGNSRR